MRLFIGLLLLIIVGVPFAILKFILHLSIHIYATFFMFSLVIAGVIFYITTLIV